MSRIRFFDTHTHMDADWFDEDRHEAIMRAKQADVDYFVNIGCDLESSVASVKMAEDYDFVYAAVGVHPHSASEYTDEVEAKLEELLGHEKALVVGEIGLDYHYDYSPRDVQREVFKRQMELARRTGKKVVIHSREATEDTLEILRMFPDVTGVLHCYSGSLETAKILVKMGYMLSFTGVVTYKNAVKSHEVIEWLDLDKMMAETDSPYLTPVPFRHKRNESAHVGLVVEKMADIKGISKEEMAKITFDNAIKFFGIKENI